MTDEVLHTVFANKPGCRGSKKVGERLTNEPSPVGEGVALLANYKYRYNSRRATDEVVSKQYLQTKGGVE